MRDTTNNNSDDDQNVALVFANSFAINGDVSVSQSARISPGSTSDLVCLVAPCGRS